MLTAGVYSIPSASILNGILTLNANGNPNAEFIFEIQGPLSKNVDSKIELINGAKGCNIFWKVEGLVDMAAGTSMRGTVIANNAEINMNTKISLEGRALSTAGTSINGKVYTTDGAFTTDSIRTTMSPICPTINVSSFEKESDRIAI